MAIVNQLSFSQHRRDEMVNGRNIFTYFANIFMLMVSLFLIITIPGQRILFAVLTTICLVVGGGTTMFYLA
jgi:hypothetical protein